MAIAPLLRNTLRLKGKAVSLWLLLSTWLKTRRVIDGPPSSSLCWTWFLSLVCLASTYADKRTYLFCLIFESQGQDNLSTQELIRNLSYRLMGTFLSVNENDISSLIELLMLSLFIIRQNHDEGWVIGIIFIANVKE